MQYSTFTYILDAGLALGLLAMGAGYLLKKRIRHRVVMVGYYIYALYWLFWTAIYLTVEHNPSNALFTIMGIGVFSYLGYHEYLNYEGNEYLVAMDWAAKATAVTAFCYLLIERVEAIGGYVVYATTWQTASIMNWIGYEPNGVPVTLGKIIYEADGPQVALEGTGINIILACTGIQAMILFLVFNIFLKADLRRKFYAFLMTVPVIYAANQFRNVAIVYLSDKGVSFDLAHNWLGKGFSFLVLIGIVIYTFRMLPEALENLFTLFDLKKRKEGKVVDGRLEFPKKDEEEKEGDGGEEAEGNEGKK